MCFVFTQVDELMRQELKNLKLAVNKEIELPVKAGKKGKVSGGTWGWGRWTLSDMTEGGPAAQWRVWVCCLTDRRLSPGHPRGSMPSFGKFRGDTLGPRLGLIHRSAPSSDSDLL